VPEAEPVVGSPWSGDVVLPLLERLRAAPARAGSTRVLAIDGRSGSGKTTLSRALQTASAGQLQAVHMDDLYPGWDGLSGAVPLLVDWVLRPLVGGGRARYRRYDWHLGEYGEWIEIPTTPLLVVEGAGSGSLACDPYLSLLVYLDAPESVRYQRGMARDGDAYRPYWDRWARQENLHFAVNRPADRADVVVDAGFSQTPGVA
jgi:uridine kinase